MTAKEKLIEEINKHHWSCDSTIGYDYSEEIADFIISDRKKILVPIVEVKRVIKSAGLWGNEGLCPEHKAIDQTLKNAGIED